MWENDPIVLQLIEYMISRGCTGVIMSEKDFDIHGDFHGYIEFEFNGINQRIYGEDIYNALHAAYRVAWDRKDIKDRFERYLIDLNNKRQKK